VCLYECAALRYVRSFPTRRSSDLVPQHKRLVLVTAHRRESFGDALRCQCEAVAVLADRYAQRVHVVWPIHPNPNVLEPVRARLRSEEHTSELQSRVDLVCRLLLEN